MGWKCGGKFPGYKYQHYGVTGDPGDFDINYYGTLHHEQRAEEDDVVENDSEEAEESSRRRRSEDEEDNETSEEYDVDDLDFDAVGKGSKYVAPSNKEDGERFIHKPPPQKTNHYGNDHYGHANGYDDHKYTTKPSYTLPSYTTKPSYTTNKPSYTTDPKYGYKGTPKPSYTKPSYTKPYTTAEYTT